MIYSGVNLVEMPAVDAAFFISPPDIPPAVALKPDTNIREQSTEGKTAMTEDTTAQEQSQGEQSPEPSTPDAPPAVALKPDTGTQEERMVSIERFNEINARAKAAEAELKKLQKAQADDQRKAAEEQGKFEELYKETQAKLEAAESAAQQAEEKRRQAELSSLRSKIAAKHKLPELWAERLRGDTEEEIEADAKAIAETLPKAAVSTATDANEGVNTNTPTLPLSEEDIKEQAAVYGVNYDFLKQYYEKLQRS